MNTSSTHLPAIVALSNIRSLHNVGAIFRTADAVKAEAILLGGLTPTPPRHEIEKTALGGTKTVPWQYHQNLVPVIREYLEHGYHLYPVELTEKAESIFSTKLQFPAIFLFGHERVGVENELLQLSETHLMLPMYGSSAKSLNVSNCAAIVLYEARRQLS